MCASPCTETALWGFSAQLVKGGRGPCSECPRVHAARIMSRTIVLVVNPLQLPASRARGKLVLPDSCGPGWCQLPLISTAIRV